MLEGVLCIRCLCIRHRGERAAQGEQWSSTNWQCEQVDTRGRMPRVEKRGDARLSDRKNSDLSGISLYMRFPALKNRGDELRVIEIRVVNRVQLWSSPTRALGEPQARV
jgi:hypothetical protein